MTTGDLPPCAVCDQPIKRRFFGLSRDLTGGVCVVCDRRVCRGCLNPGFLIRPRHVLEKHRGDLDPGSRRERPFPVCMACYMAGAHHGGL